MRGRLIFAFIAELAPLDTRGRAPVVSEQPALSEPGDDVDFKESVLVDLDDDGIGERRRRELPPVRLPCQVEPEVFDALRMLAAGDAPRSRIELVFHFGDLEREGLVDSATGDALVRPGDRLVALYDQTRALVQAVRTPPGLYATEARPIGFGLGLTNPRRNLLLVSFGERALATARTA